MSGRPDGGGPTVDTLGIDRVAARDQALVERFLQGLDPDRYRLASPGHGHTVPVGSG